MNNQDENKGFKPAGVINVGGVDSELHPEYQKGLEDAKKIAQFCEDPDNYVFITRKEYDKQLADKDKVIEALWDYINNLNGAIQKGVIGGLIHDSATIEQFTEKLLEGKDE